jgi:hypothetical protein
LSGGDEDSRRRLTAETVKMAWPVDPPVVDLPVDARSELLELAVRRFYHSSRARGQTADDSSIVVSNSHRDRSLDGDRLVCGCRHGQVSSMEHRTLVVRFFACRPLLETKHDFCLVLFLATDARRSAG